MILHHFYQIEMAIRISSIIPFVSLGDDFIRTTEKFPEVPTTANRSTKNNDIYITDEPHTIYFLDAMFY